MALKKQNKDTLYFRLSVLLNTLADVLNLQPGDGIPVHKRSEPVEHDSPAVAC